MSNRQLNYLTEVTRSSQELFKNNFDDQREAIKLKALMSLLCRNNKIYITVIARPTQVFFIVFCNLFYTIYLLARFFLLSSK